MPRGPAPLPISAAVATQSVPGAGDEATPLQSAVGLPVGRCRPCPSCPDIGAVQASNTRLWIRVRHCSQAVHPPIAGTSCREDKIDSLPDGHARTLTGPERSTARNRGEAGNRTTVSVKHVSSQRLPVAIRLALERGPARDRAPAHRIARPQRPAFGFNFGRRRTRGQQLLKPDLTVAAEIHLMHQPQSLPDHFRVAHRWRQPRRGGTPRLPLQPAPRTSATTADKGPGRRGSSPPRPTGRVFELLRAFGQPVA